MADARDRIFGQIRKSLGRKALDPVAVSLLDRRIRGGEKNLTPARAMVPQADQVELFVERMEAVDVTIDRITNSDQIATAVTAFLQGHNLPLKIRIADDGVVGEADWATAPLLTVNSGAPAADDLVGVTPVISAIAETGTLVTASDRSRPATLNFMPDTHIVVVRASQIVGTMEDAWVRLRAVFGAGELPRMVNLITGPSKTGDIELMLIKGAHGPRRQHVVLIDDLPSTSVGAKTVTPD